MPDTNTAATISGLDFAVSPLPDIIDGRVWVALHPQKLQGAEPGQPSGELNAEEAATAARVARFVSESMKPTYAQSHPPGTDVAENPQSSVIWVGIEAPGGNQKMIPMYQRGLVTGVKSKLQALAKDSGLITAPDAGRFTTKLQLERPVREVLADIIKWHAPGCSEGQRAAVIPVLERFVAAKMQQGMRVSVDLPH